MFQAAIFDMDGLLIDSEPFWKESEREVFCSLGIRVTDEMTAKTASMTTAEVTRFWYDKKPWSHISMDEVEQEVIHSVGKYIIKYGSALPGVRNTIIQLKEHGLKIGLATNSPFILIPIVLRKLNLTHLFDAVTSSDEVTFAKPDPEIYTLTVQKLDVAPEKCLVFEDSTYGLKAALTAGMNTILVNGDVISFNTGVPPTCHHIDSLEKFNFGHYCKFMTRKS